ncbi:MAG: thymidine phosphorylase family protein [Gammaproteobacteria bacterium]|nr:thymidine phosphorylase family protein [Gammaproteobacteria bacterium]
MYDSPLFRYGGIGMKNGRPTLRLKYLGIDTYKEAVIYMRPDCYVCESEGFEAQARVRVSLDHSHTIIATLNTVASDVLKIGEASLSEYAWKLLGAREGDTIHISHPEPIRSLAYVRGKIHGNKFPSYALLEIMRDIVAGNYSDIHIAAFLTACAGNHLDRDEIRDLTKAMVNVGERFLWPSELVVDKHCVGGLPGNRTTLVIVPIVAAFGLTIPKTSSRAITSSAGTADTMEVLAPVELSFSKMLNVVEEQNGCIAWGGTSTLSPADDIIIRVERVIDLDSEAQLVASILSKKLAAGSNHIVIDIPIGPTSKVRDQKKAIRLRDHLISIGQGLGLTIKVVFTDGAQPIGRGIGPALEARDVLAVLQNQPEAPQDLRDRSLMLAGEILEFSPKVVPKSGFALAKDILVSGKAWKKFQDICEAQGGMREVPVAQYKREYLSRHTGKISAIDNRMIARIAKLAGAPQSKEAGVDLHVHVGAQVEKDQPLLTVHSEARGELDYAFHFISQEDGIFQFESNFK